MVWAHDEKSGDSCRKNSVEDGTASEEQEWGTKEEVYGYGKGKYESCRTERRGCCGKGTMEEDNPWW